MGSGRHSTDSTPFAVRDSASGQVIAEVADASPADAVRALDAASAASEETPGVLVELALLVVVEMVLGMAVLVCTLVFASVVFIVVSASLAQKWCVSRGWRRRR